MHLHEKKPRTSHRGGFRINLDIQSWNFELPLKRLGDVP